jgi:fucose 4-O-acetylase-like acetyltransferase
VGYLPFDGYILGISRTFVFFPFFLLGHRLSPEIFDKIKFSRRKTISIIFLVMSLFFFLVYNKIDYHIFYGVLASPVTYNIGVHSFYRLGSLFFSLLLSLAFLQLLPKEKNYFSHFGSNSLSPYIWHGFGVKTLILINIFSPLINNQFLFLSSSFIVAIILGLTLSSDTIKKFTFEITFQKNILLLKNRLN